MNDQEATAFREELKRLMMSPDVADMTDEQFDEHLLRLRGQEKRAALAVANAHADLLEASARFRYSRDAVTLAMQQRGLRIATASKECFK